MKGTKANGNLICIKPSWQRTQESWLSLLSNPLDQELRQTREPRKPDQHWLHFTCTVSRGWVCSSGAWAPTSLITLMYKGSFTYRKWWQGCGHFPRAAGDSAGMAPTGSTGFESAARLLVFLLPEENLQACKCSPAVPMSCLSLFSRRPWGAGKQWVRGSLAPSPARSSQSCSHSHPEHSQQLQTSLKEQAGSQGWAPPWGGWSHIPFQELLFPAPWSSPAHSMSSGRALHLTAGLRALLILQNQLQLYPL